MGSKTRLRTSVLGRTVTVVAASITALALTAPSALALTPPPDAPVTVPDTVAVYPHGMATVDVLANDVDPDDRDGSQLGICRLPESSGGLSVVDGGDNFGDPGTLEVQLGRARLPEPVVVEYYVCDRSYLTKSTLTVTTREVAPVTARKVPGRPGRLKFVNDNGTGIRLLLMSKRDFQLTRVPARSSRVVRVHDRVVQWQATIGTEDNMGIAGHGVVKGIRLPKNEPKRPSGGGEIVISMTTIISPLIIAMINGAASAAEVQAGLVPGIGASGS